MNLLEIIFSFLRSQGKSFLQDKTDAITQQIANNARLVTRLLIYLVISIVLFSIGFSMLYSGIVRSLEEYNRWLWSPSIVAGFLLTGVAIASLVYFLGEKRWTEVTNANKPSLPPTPQKFIDPVLEGALALLITEYAQSLKEKRNAPNTSSEPLNSTQTNSHPNNDSISKSS